MEIERNNGSDQVELRSEKVRNIIGTIPPALVRWGIAVITIIFVILMLVFFGGFLTHMGKVRAFFNTCSFLEEGCFANP